MWLLVHNCSTQWTVACQAGQELSSLQLRPSWSLSLDTRLFTLTSDTPGSPASSSSWSSSENLPTPETSLTSPWVLESLRQELLYPLLLQFSASQRDGLPTLQITLSTNQSAVLANLFSSGHSQVSLSLFFLLRCWVLQSLRPWLLTMEIMYTWMDTVPLESVVFSPQSLFLLWEDSANSASSSSPFPLSQTTAQISTLSPSLSNSSPASLNVSHVSSGLLSELSSIALLPSQVMVTLSLCWRTSCCWSHIGSLSMKVSSQFYTLILEQFN